VGDAVELDAADNYGDAEEERAEEEGFGRMYEGVLEVGEVEGCSGEGEGAEGGEEAEVEDEDCEADGVEAWWSKVRWIYYRDDG
jgi:hypothetical protein